MMARRYKLYLQNLASAHIKNATPNSDNEFLPNRTLAPSHTNKDYVVRRRLLVLSLFRA